MVSADGLLLPTWETWAARLSFWLLPLVPAVVGIWGVTNSHKCHHGKNVLVYEKETRRAPEAGAVLVLNLCGDRVDFYFTSVESDI